ncbi:helix-turn-helix domain-containing protein [Paenibacillus sp. MBLB4367]|uniref:helix-turn-helix domain-containing protein n=1 Tax=Paenibacillus sp. MBLB4367 TaxID=3384767 RepID=UPI00390802B1
MTYDRFQLQRELVIDELFTFFFYELRKNYYFEGEKHDFWEFLYVDKGEIEIVTDSHSFAMKQGDMVFYSPNEFHSCRASSRHAPNVIIISFECKAPAMSFFAGKQFLLEDGERAILTRLVKEAYDAFDPPIDAWKRSQILGRKEGAPFGSEQLIKNYLEILLIEMFRRGQSIERVRHKLSSLAQETNRHDLTRHVIAYMNEHIGGSLTLDGLCAVFQTGKTQLKTGFKAATGLGIIEYFQRLKIDKAKTMIREGTRNFTEIADTLGYSSIHYFSRHFKKATGTTPSEYARTVGARIE